MLSVKHEHARNFLEFKIAFKTKRHKIISVSIFLDSMCYEVNQCNYRLIHAGHLVQLKNSK